MSDFKQCLNQLQHNLISLLVNFSCELGFIITRYNFLKVWIMILSNIQLQLNVTCDQRFIWIWYNNDQIWLPRGLRSDFQHCLNRLPTLPNITLGQFSVSRKLIINGGAIRLRGLLLITRLLGCPQPQMYPPVTLNQYKWVNRTLKHVCIYASMPHENFEIDFTSKLSSQQHVKYGSNLMKICY